jgi:uncharacterized membrane protein
MESAKTAFSQVIDRNREPERQHRKNMARQGMGERVNVGNGERIVSALAGGLLAMWGLRRRGTVGYGAAAIGTELLYRGTTGHCHAYSAMGVSTRENSRTGQPSDVNHDRAVDVRHGVIIDRPRQELYAIWRDFSTLPQFMMHLERVDVLSPTISHWVTKGPAGTKVEWDAEIVDEREGEWIAWRSIEPAQVANNGTVMFRDLGRDRTEVFVTLEAQPPAGKLGDLVARMFGRSPQQEVRQALDRFKKMIESGHDFGARQQSHAEREVSLSNPGLSDVPSNRKGRADRTISPDSSPNASPRRTDDFTTSQSD